MKDLSEEHRKIIQELINFSLQNICTHDETYRGGILWEICTSCGARWADDEGGKPEFKVPDPIINAQNMLDGDEVSHRKADPAINKAVKAGRIIDGRMPDEILVAAKALVDKLHDPEYLKKLRKLRELLNEQTQ